MVILDILDVVMNASTDDPVWGLKLCEQTGHGTGTIYPALDRLLQAGWIKDKWEEPASRRPAAPPLLHDQRRRQGRVQANGRRPSGSPDGMGKPGPARRGSGMMAPTFDPGDDAGGEPQASHGLRGIYGFAPVSRISAPESEAPPRRATATWVNQLASLDGRAVTTRITDDWSGSLIEALQRLRDAEQAARVESTDRARQFPAASRVDYAIHTPDRSVYIEAKRPTYSAGARDMASIGAKRCRYVCTLPLARVCRPACRR